MTTYLSKSRYISGQQCIKLLWFSSNGVEPPQKMDDGANDRLKVGEEVGNMAKKLFPDGVEIDYNMDAVDLMIEQTAEAIVSEKPIYEATFLADGVLVRVDLMTKGINGWDMYEVKSSSNLKKYHHEDAAFQWYTLSLNPKLKMNRAYVITINKDFLKNEYENINSLFTLNDVTDFVTNEARDIPEKIHAFKEVMNQNNVPKIEIGPHCSKPHPCQYMKDCWGTYGNDSIFNLYRMKSKDKFDLYRSGIKTFDQLPEDFDLTDIQMKQVQSFIKSEPIIDRDQIDNFISQINYPISYLDFETFQEAIPSFENQRPYQQMPFQFSLHVQHESNGKLEHFQFIAKHGDDPRRSISNELLKNIPEYGTIISYNQSFEINCIKTLARSNPDRQDELLMLNERFLDLIIPFRKGYYYHPKFNGSFSIKSVLPVLCPNEPELNYENLNITNGGDASLIYKNLNIINADDYDITLSDLYAYCRLDTLAMVKILEHLTSINIENYEL